MTQTSRASTQINRLPRATRANLSDLLVLWSGQNQATRNIAVSQFLDDLGIPSTGGDARTVKGLMAITHINANFIVTSDSILEQELIVCDAQGAPVSITLPALSSLEVGEWIIIKKSDNTANQVTVLPNGSDKIDGDANLTLNGVNRPSAKIVNDGFQWVMINA